MDFVDMMTGPGAWGMWMLYAAVAGAWMVVVVLVAWALRTISRAHPGQDQHRSALEVLERRYAEGTMDEAGLRRMRLTLSRPSLTAEGPGDSTLHLVTQTSAAREITDLDWGPRPVA